MSRKTRYLNLHLPDENEYYRIEEDQNQNFEKIDTKLSEINDGKVSKVGDTMTGDLTIRKNMPVIKFSDTRVGEREGYIGFGTYIEKKLQIINPYSDGITEISGPNLETQSKEVIGAINEVNNIKEPKFTKNTAFNKNFGTTKGTVLEGNYCPYAVGDIYITTNTSNPATLWVGTGWEKIEGKFLRATNRGESTGINGGSDSKTLTLANLPSHTHSASSENAGYHTHTQVAHSHTQPSHKHAISRDYSGSSIMSGFASNSGEKFGWTDKYTQPAGGESTGTATPAINGNGSHTHRITVSSTGSGTSFDIKPAYYTVNVWKRTR